MTPHRLLARDVILMAAGTVGILCWTMMRAAQMVGPTSQPHGAPITPEQAEQVEQEIWAIHGQATNVWLLCHVDRFPAVSIGAEALRSPIR
jgi:hypothetical protein